MEEIINIQSIDPTTFEFQEYSQEDISLISNVDIDVSFNPETDYVSYTLYDYNKNIIINIPSDYRNYSLVDNIISLDPVEGVKDAGQEQGQFNAVYNFLTNKLGSSYVNQLYIEEISQDRTEIRLNSLSILNSELKLYCDQFITEIRNSPNDYEDFYLNFNKNQLIIANNILLDTSDPLDYSVIIKLYEPLPTNFTLKTECWVVQQIADPIAYYISIDLIYNNIDNKIYLKGPNLNLPIKDQINNSTNFSNYTSLSNTITPQGSGSFQYQLNSLLVEKGIEINIDYSDYSNFINFSSAQTRVENFYYKLSLIETYNESASYSSGITTNTYISSSNNVWQTKINELITGFDSYEYFLYFESGSANWPKSNSTYPYVNETSTSVIGQNWLVNQSTIAESFDLENNNSLVNSIPLYIREDAANSQFELFIEMIGQHFDSIFVYLQDVTNKYNADNRLDYGVSKDLVADIIRDLGVKIYQNNFSSNDLYQALLGITP